MTRSPLDTPRLFSVKALQRLIIPLVIEQLLTITIGLADTVMVTSVGEHAVSGVSLVDNVSMLVATLFTALTTGGAVVAAQYIGRRDPYQACRSAKQLFNAVALIGLLFSLVAIFFRGSILHLVFGDLNDDIFTAAKTYFLFTALSYPFLGLYNASAALFRSMGNSKVSMFTSFLMNILNVSINAIFIFGFKVGVIGAGLGTLCSRVVGCIVITRLLCRTDHTIHIMEPRKIEFDLPMIGRILKVGVPTGLENGMFQLGKLMVLGLITPMGQAAIAANAISNSVGSILLIPGMAVSLSLITVVGQCMGARDPDQATYYTKRLIGVLYLAMGTISVIIFFACPTIIQLFHLSPEAAAMAVDVIHLFSASCVFFWAPSFAIPNVLRAAGDGKYTMVVSMISMWTFRVGLSYVFVLLLDFGIMGVWISMIIDWIGRGLAFGTRFLRGKWKTKVVI